MTTKRLLQNTTLSLVLSLSFTSAAKAQGEAVARDLKRYIEAAPSKAYSAPMDSDMGSYRADPAASPGIEPEPRRRDPITFRPEEEIAINGQEVDESNNVVYKAFEEHPEWKNVTVVADWTGSMYPYAGSVMRWHKLNMDRKLIQHMVLFNDGDDNKRGGSPKALGAAGGMYHPDPNDLDDFLEKVKVAVDNGDGGESEENDVEAILEAIHKYPDTGDIVLIADNSGMRDIAMLDKVNRPVHVVMVNGGWVKDYVKLAYKSGGTITTLTESLDFRTPGKAIGGVVTLNGLKYKVE